MKKMLKNLRPSIVLVSLTLSSFILMFGSIIFTLDNDIKIFETTGGASSTLNQQTQKSSDPFSKSVYAQPKDPINLAPQAGSVNWLIFSFSLVFLFLIKVIFLAIEKIRDLLFEFIRKE